MFFSSDKEQKTSEKGKGWTKMDENQTLKTMNKKSCLLFSSFIYWIHLHDNDTYRNECCLYAMDDELLCP